MHPFLKKYLFLFVSLASFFLVIFLENGLLQSDPEDGIVRTFQKDLNTKKQSWTAIYRT